MTDTAQSFGTAETDPNAQLENAANAFKAFDNPVAAQPRDETGKFASAEQPEEIAEAEEPEAEQAEGDEAEADEADTEAAEPAQPLPPSWPEDMAEQWSQLPAETQAFLANREAERERAVNAKFQESANARKASELAAREAQTKRQDYLAALETVEAIYTVPKPDPRAFGYGTPQYDAAGFNLALAQYEQTTSAIAQFKEQREALQKEAAAEEENAFAEWKQQHEAQFAPKLLADVPELKDPAKAEPLLRELVRFAIDSGIPEDVFAEDAQDQVTSAQLHILWMAQQYAKLKSVKSEPKPRQASPAVRPGVSSPRSAQKAVQAQKVRDRLAREGSVDAGAALWKQFLKG